MTDLAWRLLTHGYRAIDADRAARGGAGTYPTRLLGRRAVVVSGEQGAELFYDESRMERAGAVPPPLAWLLFGRGAVHGLDGEHHRDRKQLFLDVIDDEAATDVAETAADNLHAALGLRPAADVPLFSTLVECYGDAVLRWTGVPVDRAESRSLSHRYAAIVDGFGFSGSAYARGWHQRTWLDRWARGVVRAVRAGDVTPRRGTPLDALAAGDLDDRVAAVELGNLIRPTIAVAWLGVFAVAAVATCTTDTQRLELAAASAPHRGAPPAGGSHRATTSPDVVWSFAEEVRRTTPFVPALAARATATTGLDGVRIHRGDRVVLDVLGINHDPRTFEDPGSFVPDRFVGHRPSPFALVPQGGGFPTGHRCPGESIALRLLAATTQVFAGAQFELVGSAASDLARIPTRPSRLSVRVGG